MIVVSGSGPLISLMKAEQLDLLQKLYQETAVSLKTGTFFVFS